MSTGLTFTQGLLIGQLSVVLLIGAFIKFFIFGEAPSPPPRSSTAKSSSKHVRTLSLHSLASSERSPPRALHTKRSSTNVLRPLPTNATDTESILRKTYYSILPNKPGQGYRRNQSIHQPESLDWFNVLIAQTIAQYRQTAYTLKDGSPNEPPSILSSLTAALNSPDKKPSFIDAIKITEISLGEEFPIFSNVRVIAVDDDVNSSTGGRLQALMDFDLSDDNLTLAIETSLILNYPKPFSAVLPLALAVSVVRFSGTLAISFVPAQDNGDPVTAEPGASKPKTNLAFSFLPDYRLDLSVRSLIGSRSRLQDVPKIAQLVEARVHAWFEERVVEPRVQVVGLPGLWPRLGKTRVREGQEDDRPMSQDGPKSEGKPDSTSSAYRRSAEFPSQEETEAIFEGLRWRGPAGSTAPRSYTREEDMRIPGALPG